jgi:hypothetical protein
VNRSLPTTAPRVVEVSPVSAPVLSFGHLTVDLGFLALLRKTVEVQRIKLVDVALSLDRAKDGTLLLPAAVPATEPGPPAKGPGWGVLIQRELRGEEAYRGERFRDRRSGRTE